MKLGIDRVSKLYCYCSIFDSNRDVVTAKAAPTFILLSESVFDWYMSKPRSAVNMVQQSHLLSKFIEDFVDSIGK